VLTEARDWFGFIGDVLIGATIASYFGNSLFGGNKIKDLFIDELQEAFDRPIENEDPE
jgi:hypothetical protein